MPHQHRSAQAAVKLGHRTKTFHVKHFGTIGQKNQAKARTSGTAKTSGIVPGKSTIGGFWEPAHGVAAISQAWAITNL